MKRKTNSVLNGREFSNSLSSSLQAVNSSMEKLFNSKLIFNYGNSIDFAAPADVLRLCREICAKNKFDVSVMNMLINTVFDAEKRAPGSGIIALIAFSNLYPRYLKLNIMRDKCSIQILDQKIFDSIKIILENSRRANSEEIFGSLKFFNRNHEIDDIVKKALYAAGAAGNISIEKHENEETHIEKFSGNRFLIHLDSNFFQYVQKKSIKLSGPKVLVVDGVIEDCNEIEVLIRSAHRERRQFVIFARGFNKEVTDYLGSNFNSSVVEILPLVVNFDEVGINQLVDVAVCSGTDVLSSLKGETIDSVKWEFLSSVESIVIERHGISIQNTDSLHRCLLQRNKLISELEECAKITDSDVRQLKTKILTQRINSMTPSNTTVKIGKKYGSMRDLYYDRCCKSIELYNEMSRWGIVDLYPENIKKCHIEEILDVLRKMQLVKVSPRILEIGIRVALSNVKSALTVNSWLKDEAA